MAGVLALICGYRPFPRKSILDPFLLPEEKAGLAVAGSRLSTRVEAARKTQAESAGRQTEKSQVALATHAIMVAEMANKARGTELSSQSKQKTPTIVGQRGTIRSIQGISDRTTVASANPTLAPVAESGRATGRTATVRSNASAGAASVKAESDRASVRSAASGGDPISFVTADRDTWGGLRNQGAAVTPAAPEPARASVQSARSSNRQPTKPEASPVPEAEEPRTASKYKGKGKGKAAEESAPVPTGKGNPPPAAAGAEAAPAPDKGKGKKGQGKRGNKNMWFRGPPLPDFLQAKAGNGKNGTGKELGSRFGSQTGKAVQLLSDELAGNDMVAA